MSNSDNSRPLSTYRSRGRHRLGLAALLALGLVTGAFLPKAHDVPFALPLLWPEEQRAFLQDGPGLLLRRAQIDEFVDTDVVSREQFIDRFLADPWPETEDNELRSGIDQRRALVRDQYLTYLDARAQLLFLQGPPRRQEVIDCAETFKPIELWTYERDDGGLATLVLYQPKPREPYRLWLPLDSKRVLYNAEMEYWLQQFEELREQFIGNPKRFDLQICPRTAEVDWATGVEGLFGFLPDRPKNDDLAVFLSPPEELAAWAKAAAAEISGLPEMVVVAEKEARQIARARKKAQKAGIDLAEYAKTVTAEEEAKGGEGEEGEEAEGSFADPTVSPLVAWERPAEAAAELELFFPKRSGQRMTSRVLVKIPTEVGLEPFVEGDLQELRLTLEGHLEHGGKSFDSFRVRYLLPPPPEGYPVALATDQLLRPEQEFLLRLKITDEISGLHMWLNRGFVVPRVATPVDQMPEVPEEVVLGMTEKLKKNRVSGYDSLILIPPEADVVFGLWRAEALVTGQKIQKVAFFLDGELQFSRRRPPFTAELRLETHPIEQVVRAEGYDEAGEIVASDEVVLNQPRGELRVRILEPVRGRPTPPGDVKVKAEVVVPEEARVTKVEFFVNEEKKGESTKPPWEAVIDVPATGDLTYITVTAELDDGLKAEDVRFLNAPEIDQIDVNLVELYTTVTDKSGLLIRDLVRGDFQVSEDGRPQTIAKFELVENLPLTMGIAIDTSGSMYESLGEAQRAAIGFLEKIISPRDKCFALAFSDRPALLMPRTSDVGAVAQRLEGLIANGATSLHDAIVTSLYYYRGIRGRRALVILSDGEDTSSSIEFRETLEYAKRSGVAVYAIGLKIGRSSISVRRKLDKLAEETGGRTIYIKEASDLDDAYAEIERELRSQYLVAYNSDQAGEPGQYHEIEVKVKGGKLKARTMRGYYS